MHAEHLGRVVVGVRLQHELAVLGQLLECRHAVAVAVALAEDEVARPRLRRLDLRVEERQRDRVEQDAVVVVGDAPAVLDLRDHVAHRLPAHGVLARVLAQQRQVVLQELHRRQPVALVELVRHGEADRAELAALLHDRVDEALREEQRLPLGAAEGLEAVLRHPRQRAHDAGADALRRLVGQLDRHLQQADRELGVRLRRDEQPAVVVDDVLGSVVAAQHDAAQHVLELDQERDAQVAVLQQRPLARLPAVLDDLTRARLLALAHRDAVPALLELLHRGLDRRRRIGALRQQEDDRARAVRLLDAVDEVQLLRLRVLLAQRARDVAACREQRAVDAHRAHEQHALERVQLALELGDLGRLGRRVLQPLAPRAVVARERVDQVAERLRARVGDGADVEPARRQPRVVGHLAVGAAVAGAALEQHVERQRVELLGAELDLARHQQHEHRLVRREEAAHHVAEHGVCQVLDDARDALLLLLRPLGAVEGQVEQAEELRQRRLVHVVDERQLVDEEVEHRAADGDGAELLGRGRDALAVLGRRRELLLDLGGRVLRLLQRLDQRVVVDEVALRLAQLLEQLVLEVAPALLVVVDLLGQLGRLVVELGLLLADRARQQLLLEALLRHGEVDDEALGEELGHERRVRQLGRHEQREALVVRQLLILQRHQQVLADALDLLVEQRVQRRVDVLGHVLHDERLAVGQRVLQVHPELLVRDLAHLGAVLLRAVAQPDERLALRVDQQRELGAGRDHDGVLDRVVVGREALELPVVDDRLLDEETHHVEVLRHGDLELLALGVEGLRQQLAAEVGVERAAVRHEGAADRDVADEAADEVLELVALARPALALAGQRVDQAVGGVHAAAAVRRVLLQLHLLRVLLLELLGEARHLGGDLGQLLLLRLALAVRRAQLVLHDARALLLGRDLLGDVDVVVHGANPHAESGDVARRLVRALARELLHPQVRQQQLARLLVDAVLLGLAEVLQGGQSARAAAETLAGGLPRVGDPHAVALGLHLDAGHGHRHVHQDADAVENALHERRRRRQRLERLEVLLRDRVQRADGLEQRRLGLGEIAGGIGLLLADLGGLGRDALLDLLDLLALDLGLGRAHLDLLDERLRLLALDAEQRLLLLQLRAHDPHVVGRLLQLLEAVVDLLGLDVELVELALVDARVAGDEGQV